MHRKLQKLLPFQLWDIAVKTVNNYSQIYNDFKDWFQNTYIPEELKITPEEIKDFVKKQLEKSLNDDAQKRALINEYIWQNYRMAFEFAAKYEKEMLNMLEK